MNSKNLQSAAVMVRTKSATGTGLLILSTSPEFDYVFTADHNIGEAVTHDIKILDGCQREIKFIDAVRNPEFDIAILKVEKVSTAERIPVCNTTTNHAHAVSIGYPGALQINKNKHFEALGFLSYSDQDKAHLYFDINNAPDPDEEKENYIAGFSGAGVFELSECRQFAKLKGIIIQRWDKNFDVKRVKCVRSDIIVELFQLNNLPPFAGIHLDFSHFTNSHPRLFNDDLLSLLVKSQYFGHLVNAAPSKILGSPMMPLPPCDDLYHRVLKLPFHRQNELLSDVFYAKLLALAYYYTHLKDIDFCANPVTRENGLKILLCCTLDEPSLSVIICRLVGEPYRDYLDNCLVAVCSTQPSPNFGVDSDKTSAIVTNYARNGGALDRSERLGVNNYLRLDRSSSKFSVYPVSALSTKVDEALFNLKYTGDDHAYDSDEIFLQTITNALNGTIKS